MNGTSTKLQKTLIQQCQSFKARIGRNNEKVKYIKESDFSSIVLEVLTKFHVDIKKKEEKDDQIVAAPYLLHV